MMRLRWVNVSLLSLLFLLALSYLFQAQPQSDGRIIVPLRVQKMKPLKAPAPPPPPMVGVRVGDPPRTPPPPPMPGVQFGGARSTGDGFQVGKMPGGVLIGAQPVNNPQRAYRIKVDANRNGDLSDEAAHVILPGSFLEVAINRPLKDKPEPLPYKIYYGRPANKDEPPAFFFAPDYRAEGELVVDSCKAALVISDSNQDGLFDERDLARQSIGLDRNGDGVVGSPFGEWLHGKQIIELCGRSLLIERLEPDGSAVILAPTSLRLARLNAPIPPFSVTPLAGKTLRSDELRGKVLLLDFWASWCSPCIEKFDIVKQMARRFGDDLQVIVVNVDEEAFVPQAKQLIEKHQLPGLQVISGQGENDAVWRIFGGIGNNSMAVPFYAVIDHSGNLSYAGRGGDDLSEINAKIDALVRARKSPAR
jgi:thiol-disulfide isomerase/thioredoxin